jgi:cytochrome c oxidase cbb3-type subunit 3
MSSPFRTVDLLWLVAALTVTGCQREDRDYHGPPPPPASVQAGISPTSLHVGGIPRPPPPDPRAAVYERNAYHLSEGKRWYDWYNCYGCHAAGGGDIGPPLMDDQWRYGGSIEQIHASILEGRPNGMPSFYGRMPDTTAWEIAAYVRSMSGNAAKDAASSRGDELQSGEPKTQVDRTPPRSGQSRSDQGSPE